MSWTGKAGPGPTLWLVPVGCRIPPVHLPLCFPRAVGGPHLAEVCGWGCPSVGPCGCRPLPGDTPAALPRVTLPPGSTRWSQTGGDHKLSPLSKGAHLSRVWEKFTRSTGYSEQGTGLSSFCLRISSLQFHCHRLAAATSLGVIE